MNRCDRRAEALHLPSGAVQALAVISILALLAIGAALANAASEEGATVTVAQPTARVVPAPASTSTAQTSEIERVEVGPIAWRRSTPVGSPSDGFLVRGVQLPPEGEDYFTWDPVLDVAPNRPWRRWGADIALSTLLRVLAGFRAAHPGVARVGVADISRPNGGPFGRRFGGLGHASHQNGLDVDLYYPRLDREERSITAVKQIDLALARNLVRRFVKAGAVYVFVGPNTRLGHKGRQLNRTVQRLVHHDDHMHVRLRPGAR